MSHQLQDSFQELVKKLDDPDCARITVFVAASDKEIQEALAALVKKGYWFVVRKSPRPGITGVSCSKSDLYKCGINPFFYHIHSALAS